MGDRANIVVLQNNGPAICVYSHWGGERFQTDVQDWLASGGATPMVGDDNYFTWALIQEANRQGQHVSGVGNRLDDNEPNRRVMVVDASTGRWGFYDYADAERAVIEESEDWRI